MNTANTNLNRRIISTVSGSDEVTHRLVDDSIAEVSIEIEDEIDSIAGHDVSDDINDDSDVEPLVDELTDSDINNVEDDEDEAICSRSRDAIRITKRTQKRSRDDGNETTPPKKPKKISEKEATNLKKMKEERKDLEEKRGSVQIEMVEIEGVTNHFINDNIDNHRVRLEDAMYYVEKGHQQVFPRNAPRDEPYPMLLAELCHVAPSQAKRTDDDDQSLIENTKNKICVAASTLLRKICSDNGFDMDLGMTECVESTLDTIKHLIPDGEGGGDAYNTATLIAAMKVQAILVEKQILLMISNGDIYPYKRKMRDGTTTVALWARVPRIMKIYYCEGAIRKLGRNKRVEECVMANNHDYFVDLVTGDVIGAVNDVVNRVLKATDNGRSLSYKIAVEDQQFKERKRHHVIVHAMDPKNDLFGPLQRFMAYRGYISRSPKNLELLKPQLCEKAKDDYMGAACKTDVDHCLGYLNDSCYTLHRCHHQINQTLHHMREDANDWGHPYSHHNYNEEFSRMRPDFYEQLPPTLAAGEINSNLTWMTMYNELLIYKKEHGGSTSVPQRHGNLGTWVKNQRHRCKLKYRRDLLDKIGFEWHVRVRGKDRGGGKSCADGTKSSHN